MRRLLGDNVTSSKYVNWFLYVSPFFFLWITVCSPCWQQLIIFIAVQNTDDKCVLCATFIRTYVCVVCMCIRVCLCGVCVVCVCIMCQCSYMDICIGLRLMSSVILNFFTVFFELGSLSKALDSPIHLILLASLFRWFCLLFFVWNYMMLCIPSTYVVSGKSRLLSSCLPGKCLNSFAVSVAPAF